MIIVAGGVKGGTGKSTVATNLAVLRSLAGRDILLVDADPQGSSADFTALRDRQRDGGAGFSCVRILGTSIRPEVSRLRDRFHDVIIDTGARDGVGQRAALVVADLVLIPTAPRSFDVWALEDTARLIEEMRPANSGLLAAVFLNRADPAGQGSENEEAADLLRETPGLTFLDTPLGNRKAFAHAAAQGLSVVEIERHDPKAEAEIRALYDAAFAPNAGPLWTHGDVKQTPLEWSTQP